MPKLPGINRLTSLDPTGLTPRGVELARSLLGATDSAAAAEDLPENKAAQDGVTALTPAQEMEELLQRSMFQTPAESLEALAALVVREIVPDEARIIAALADGHAYPLVHIEARDRTRASRRVLSNASSVGRAAGVALPARTPTYLHHLFGLGLIDECPEDKTLRDDYSILTTDDAVRKAVAEADADGRARLVNRTVRLSALGQSLWTVWRPEHHPQP